MHDSINFKELNFGVLIMKELENIIIIEKEKLPYGHIKCNLNKIIKKYGVSKNKLSKMTGATYQTVQRYCNPNRKIMRVDADFISMIIRITGCSLNDLLEYVPPEKIK